MIELVRDLRDTHINLIVNEHWNNNTHGSDNKERHDKLYRSVMRSYRSNPSLPDFSEITYWNVEMSFRTNPVARIYKMTPTGDEFFFRFILSRTGRFCYYLWQIVELSRVIRTQDFFDAKWLWSGIEYSQTISASDPVWKYLIINVQKDIKYRMAIGLSLFILYRDR